MKTRNILAALVVSLVGIASNANANIATYTFSNTGAAFGPGPYGTVTLTEENVSATVTDVLVTVLLNSDYFYNLAGAAGTKHDFTFNLTSGLNPIIDSYSNLFTLVGPGSYVNNPYGTFNYFFDVNGVGNNGSNNTVQSLSFKVGSNIGTGVKISNFLNSTSSTRPNSPGGYAFSADLFTNVTGVFGGVTGNVATSAGTAGGSGTPDGTPTPPPTPVPEPSTLALLGLGLLGFVLARRRT